MNVSQLLKEPVGSVRNYEFKESVDVTGNDTGSIFQGELRLMRTNRSILVEGILHTELEVTCSRCLNSFCCPLTLHIEEEYFPTIDIDSGASLPVPDDPASFTIDEFHILDLTEAIRQYALMNIPMKPICREDCAGLCPYCGVNLNRERCQCSSDRIDPRWSVLAELTNERKG